MAGIFANSVTEHDNRQLVLVSKMSSHGSNAADIEIEGLQRLVGGGV
jgi:hypothetical protein